MSPTARRLLLAASILALAGCADAPEQPTAPLTIRAGVRGGAKGGSGGSSGPAITAADPAYGERGQLGEQVTITGSGFASDAQASWELNGATAAKVHVRSTRYVSSTTLVATIDIDADAELALYDVAVYSSGKKGIGTEMFEVTQATSIGSLGGDTNAHGVNDLGEVTGYTRLTPSGPQHGFYWSEVTGMIDIGTGHPWDIDDAGTTIVGAANVAVIWTGTGASWNGPVELPHVPGVTLGRASSVASDLTTGRAVVIGGHESASSYHGGPVYTPLIWRPDGVGGWTRVVLPLPISGRGVSAVVEDVDAAGEAVGTVTDAAGIQQGVFWATDGTPTLLGPASPEGISRDGTIIVGGGTQAVYWLRDAGGVWGPAAVLPGTCRRAMAVDDAGRVLGRQCSNARRSGSVVFLPTDSGYQILALGGLGDRDDGGSVEAISRSGAWISGSAKSGSIFVGAVWRPLAPAP